MKRTLWIAGGLLIVCIFTPISGERARIRFASKKFTESIILGELAVQLARDADGDSAHLREMGGTRILFSALRAGEIDAYAEYSGTIDKELLGGRAKGDLERMAAELLGMGVRMSRPLGFDNTYAIGVKAELAEKLRLEKISDLARHPELRLGFSNEFMARQDGWPGLRDRYGLEALDAAGMDHDLAYRQLDAGAVHAMDVYTTDADIAYWKLRTLEDDRGYFPRYEALILYRDDLVAREPDVVTALLKLEGQIDAVTMMAMNGRVKLDRVTESQVAADFLGERLGIDTAPAETTRLGRIGRRSWEHLGLVRISLALAILVAIPIGIVAAKRPRFGQLLLSAVGVAQTIPALALLVVLIRPAAKLGLPSAGTGSAPALAALFLYSLLPVVRNTYTGLRDIPRETTESACAMGLTPWTRLRLIELPLAVPTILAGLKTAAVLNVGFATLGALIGAGGYGQPILTGIRLDDMGLILEGAVPAAVMALAVQGVFELAEKRLLPAPLRMR